MKIEVFNAIVFFYFFEIEKKYHEKLKNKGKKCFKSHRYVD